jgi:hypothetical protein
MIDATDIKDGWDFSDAENELWDAIELSARRLATQVFIAISSPECACSEQLLKRHVLGKFRRSGYIRQLLGYDSEGASLYFLDTINARLEELKRAWSAEPHEV